MRAASLVFCLSFAWGLVASPLSHAMGFGRVASSTLLGQPLDFSAAVRLEPGESLAGECVFAEVTSGDNRISPASVRVALGGLPGDTDRNVRVTTTVPVDEPVVAISVTLGCVDRLTRRFVAFVDPPGVNLAQAATAEVAATGGATGDDPSAGSASPTQTRAPAGRPRPVTSEPGASRPSGAVGAVAVARPARRASISTAPVGPGERRSVATRRPSAGPRLQLDAPTLVLASRTAAASSAPAPARPLAPTPAPALAPALGPALGPAPQPLATTAAASAPTLQADLLTAQRRRIASLEDEVQRLRAEARAQQQAVLAVQAAVPTRRAGRYANPRVYSLAGLAFLGTVLVCGFLGRRSRDRAAARWAAAMRPGAIAADRPPPTPEVALPPASSQPPPAETGPEDTRAPQPEPPAQRTAPLAVMHFMTPVASAPSSLPDASIPTVRAGAQALREQATATVGSASRPPPDVLLPVVTDEVAPRPDRSSSVEELIDLDQQVDFFIALGQDDAALELLQQHAADERAAGPVPLLKLLEIHRRLGDRSAHDRLRVRIDRDFNVHAPAWESDAAQGRSLDAYPVTLARLQAVWGVPAQAIALLDRAVFRRDAADPAFDLPAYRELLFLYSIARDHAEREATGPNAQVDLLLPLDGHAYEAPIERLSARQAGVPDFANSELLTAPLDLDVSFEASPATAPRAVPRFDSAETVPAALRRPADYSNESAFVDFEIDLPELLPPARRV